MAIVSDLNFFLFSYFIFVPTIFFLRLFIMNVYYWASNRETHPRTKLFDINHAQLNLIFSIGIGFLLFQKAFSSSFDATHLFLYFSILVLLIIVRMITSFSWNKVYQLEIDTIFTVTFWLLFAIASLTFCYDFVVFLFTIELISTIYFFYLLFFITKDQISLVKFKNLLVNYLFISFFTLCGFTISLFLILKTCGTANFTELNCVANLIPVFTWNLLLITFLVKLGGPGVFFFKVELYKILPFYSLIFFSICSFFVNSLILFFLFKVCVAFYTSNSFLILMSLLIFNIFFLIRGFQLMSLCHFLGLSAVNTWGLVVLFFLIIWYDFY